MIEAALGIGFIWFVWKLATRSLDRADRDCEIARLLAADRKREKPLSGGMEKT